MFLTVDQQIQDQTSSPGRVGLGLHRTPGRHLAGSPHNIELDAGSSLNPFSRTASWTRQSIDKPINQSTSTLAKLERKWKSRSDSRLHTMKIPTLKRAELLCTVALMVPGSSFTVPIRLTQPAFQRKLEQKDDCKSSQTRVATLKHTQKKTTPEHLWTLSLLLVLCHDDVGHHEEGVFALKGTRGGVGQVLHWVLHCSVEPVQVLT